MEICGDNRFEIIAKAKAHLLDATNIDTSEEEMKVLDNFLFRCWQMGWLDRYDRKTEPQTCENRECKNYDTINDHCMFIEQCHYESKDASTANPYKIVLEDLKQVPMFTGKYDGKNGNRHFIYGIVTVLEYIADKAGDEEYEGMFLDNLNKSVYGDKAVVKK